MSFIVGHWTWLPLSYFILGNPEIIFIPKYMSCAGHKHGGGKTAAAGTGVFVFSHKSKITLFNVKIMHTEGVTEWNSSCPSLCREPNIKAVTS